MGRLFGGSDPPADKRCVDMLSELESFDDVPAPSADFVARLGANLRQRQQLYIRHETVGCARTHSAESRAGAESSRRLLVPWVASRTMNVLGHVALVALIGLVVAFVYIGPFQRLDSQLGAGATPTTRMINGGVPCPGRQDVENRVATPSNTVVTSAPSAPELGYRPRIDVDGEDITPAMAHEILETLQALIACDGHYGQLANLYTEEFFAYHYNHQAAILIPLQPAAVTIREPRQLHDGRVVAEVRIDGCLPRLVAFKRSDQRWLIDDVQPLDGDFGASCVATPVADSVH